MATTDLGDIVIPIACYYKGSEPKTRSQKIGKLMETSGQYGTRIWIAINPLFLLPGLLTEYRKATYEYTKARGQDAAAATKSGDIALGVLKPSGKPLLGIGSASDQTSASGPSAPASGPSASSSGTEPSDYEAEDDDLPF